MDEQIIRAFDEVANVCKHRMAVREAGFTDEALKYPRSWGGLVALCAWNGTKPEQAPLGWRYAPNKATLDAWERVAATFAELYSNPKR